MLYYFHVLLWDLAHLEMATKHCRFVFMKCITGFYNLGLIWGGCCYGLILILHLRMTVYIPALTGKFLINSVTPLEFSIHSYWNIKLTLSTYSFKDMLYTVYIYLEDMIDTLFHFIQSYYIWHLMMYIGSSNLLKHQISFTLTEKNSAQLIHVLL